MAEYQLSTSVACARIPLFQLPDGSHITQTYLIQELQRLALLAGVKENSRGTLFNKVQHLGQQTWPSGGQIQKLERWKSAAYNCISTLRSRTS